MYRPFALKHSRKVTRNTPDIHVPGVFWRAEADADLPLCFLAVRDPVYIFFIDPFLRIPAGTAYVSVYVYR